MRPHFEEIKDSTNYAISLLDAGYSFLLLAKLDSAEHYTLQGLRMAELIDSRRRSRLLSVIWALSIRSGKNIKSLGLLLSVKDNIEKDDYSYFYSLSNVYVQQEQYDSAIYYAEYIIKNDSDLYGQASAYLSLYEVAKKT